MIPRDAETQLTRLYEQGMPVGEIAESMGYNESAVHMALERESRDYRVDVQMGRVQIPEADVMEAVQCIIGVMKDETAATRHRLAAARWIVEEATGRNAAKAVMPQVNVNVVAIQDHLKRYANLKMKYAPVSREALTDHEAREPDDRRSDSGLKTVGHGGDLNRLSDINPPVSRETPVVEVNDTMSKEMQEK